MPIPTDPPTAEEAYRSGFAAGQQIRSLETRNADLLVKLTAARAALEALEDHLLRQQASHEKACLTPHPSGHERFIKLIVHTRNTTNP